MYKKFIKDYLTVKRKERIGIVTVLLILLFVYLIPTLFSKKREPFPIEEGNLLARLTDSSRSRQHADYEPNEEERPENYQYQVSSGYPQSRQERFPFDPNTATEDDWNRMGLDKKTTQTLINYRNKGGRFFKKEDLMKVWGMKAEFYEAVADYITLNSPQKDENQDKYITTSYVPPNRDPQFVEVNQADTSAFISLPGIGSKLSQRIINFRNSLGGFHSVEQVRETYGLPGSTFQKIKSRLTLSTPVKKLNINSATKEELKAHPYIKWSLANSIVEYRNQHGPYESLDALKKIVTIDEATYNKTLPYLTW